MRFLIFFNRFFIYLLLVFISVLSSSNATEKEYDKNEIIAHLGELPGLINADGSGPFVDFVRRIDELDSNVNINIYVYPIHRALYGVINGTAHFALPAIRADDPEGKLPFRFSSTTFGLVTHVLYTNKNKPFTSEQLWRQPANYIIEAVPEYMPFNVFRSSSINSSFLKLSMGRIDGFVWAQEEADISLRRLDLENIRRQFFYDFEDVFIIPKGPEGDWIDAYLTQVIDKLEEGGELDALYKSIHLPYDDWQF
ncbi:ABC transporter substrate-binding protein [Vibrio metschnikovii]|uniref:ABC transporter substrate-binding protein n=1 Tax=Vibrio metschnikovii TaxID=28172 RepID=UPI001C30A996|nr:ABC transporter substrate-binding protein [Vibrio metschnikovii]